ncbi:MAG: type II secretion system GspH family protein [Heliobacteriaceae bacterium]|nr:type II secretion system GspH family protein [Heliobacteriaceae bacterium]
MKKGFTLAEVLITLGIIGVVAALTLPSLIANYKEKATVVKVKKAYSVLSKAYQFASNEYGEPANWDLKGYDSAEGSKNLRDILGDRMIDVKKGLIKDYYSAIISLDGSSKYLFSTSTTSAFLTLPDGTAIVFFIESADCSQSRWGTGSYENVCAQIDVITDQKQLHAGINYFPFYLTAKGIVPMGGEGNTRNFETHCRKNSTISANGWGCTAWVAANENMDYLHCDDLTWSGKTKCK